MSQDFGDNVDIDKEIDEMQTEDMTEEDLRLLNGLGDQDLTAEDQRELESLNPQPARAKQPAKATTNRQPQPQPVARKQPVAQAPTSAPKTAANPRPSQTQTPAKVPPPLQAPVDSVQEFTQILQDHIATSTEIIQSIKEEDPQRAGIHARNIKHYRAALAELSRRQGLLAAAKSSHPTKNFRILVPSFRVASQEIRVRTTINRLSLDELEIIVSQMFDVPTTLFETQRGQKVSYQLTFSFPFPSAESPQVFTTETMKVVIPTSDRIIFPINVTRFFNIDRSSNQLKHCKTRKLDVTVHRVQSGFFRTTRDDVGTCSIPLAALLNHCTLSGQFPVSSTRNPRAQTGCTMEATINVRQPIKEDDFKIMQETALLIDAWPQQEFVEVEAQPVVSTAVARPAPAPVVQTLPPAMTANHSPASTQGPSLGAQTRVHTTRVVHEEEEPEAIEHPVPTQINPPSAAVQAAVLEGGSEDVPDILDPFGVKVFVSNDVMEAEIVRLNQIKASLPPDEQPVINLQILLISNRLSNLVCDVQEEKLTFEDYLQIVEHRIKMDQKLADALEQRNNRNDAREVRKRVQIMTTEVQNARANL